MAVVEKKRQHREKRRKRVRRKVAGTAERPRLSVYRSNVHIYAQLVDDVAGNTLAAADSREVGEAENRKEAARKVGELIASRARGRRHRGARSSTAAATNTTAGSRRSPRAPAPAG